MAHLIENVPFFPQETYQCGPLSLAEVLKIRQAYKKEIIWQYNK